MNRTTAMTPAMKELTGMMNLLDLHELLKRDIALDLWKGVTHMKSKKQKGNRKKKWEMSGK